MWIVKSTLPTTLDTDIIPSSCCKYKITLPAAGSSMIIIIDLVCAQNKLDERKSHLI